MKNSKIRLLICLMIATLLFSVMAIGAFAAESVVAKINGSDYTSFDAAITAANAMSGDVVVEIYAKVEYTSSTANLNGAYDSITFVGKTADAEICITRTGGGAYLQSSKTVYFTDLILSKADPKWENNAGHMGNYFSIQGGVATYTNCTFTNGACTSTGTATYNGCTFQNTSEYGLWVYDDAIVTVNGGTIDSAKGIKVYSEGETSVTSTLTVENATFTENVTQKPAVAIGYAAAITLIGNTYNNPTPEIELDSGSDADCEGIVFVATDTAGNDISADLECIDRSNSNAACGVIVTDLNGDTKIYTKASTAAADATADSTVTLLHDSSETVEFAPGVVLEKNGYTADSVTIAKVVATVDGVEYTSLQEALNAAALGSGNVTVEILSDVDLSGIDWNPVNVSGPGYPVVTVNGNDYTITGLNDMLFSGTWAGGSGLIINNLTIANSVIENDVNDAIGTVGVGAFIGYPSASKIITLNNCHLVDSTVRGGHWTGGLIGISGGYSGSDGPVYMDLTIEGCSVTGCTIEGKGSVGGIIGHAANDAWTGVDISGVEVQNNTVTSTGSSTVKAGAIMGTIGAAGQPTTSNGQTFTGGVSVDAVVSGNEVTSNNTVINTVYGRQGSTGGDLEITGGDYEHFPVEEDVVYAGVAYGTTIAVAGDLYTEHYPATINGQGYESLSAAFAAVGENQTIVITGKVFSETVELPATLKNVKVIANDGVVVKNTVIKTPDGATELNYDGVIFDGVVFENSRINIVGWRSNASFKNFIVTNCKFSNIANGATENLAAAHFNVASSELVENLTFTNNTVDGITGGESAALYASVTGDVVISGNTIKNVSGSGMVISFTDANVTITENAIENWATGGKGRAIRCSIPEGTSTLAVVDNTMSRTDAPEEFVKVTGITDSITVSIEENLIVGNTLSANGPIYLEMAGGETIEAPDNVAVNENQPHIKDGNWWIGSTDTGIPATGSQGPQGEVGATGPQGENGATGPQGAAGADGQDAIFGIDGKIILIACAVAVIFSIITVIIVIVRKDRYIFWR